MFGAMAHSACVGASELWRVRPALPCGGGAAAGLPPGFVYLRDVAPGIAQDMRYAGFDNFTGRPLPGYDAAECVLRRDVAQALARVAADLAAAPRPEGLRLLPPGPRGRGLCALGAGGRRRRDQALLSALEKRACSPSAISPRIRRIRPATRSISRWCSCRPRPRRPSTRTRATAPAPRRRSNARPTIRSTWAPASTASTTKAARRAPRSRPSSSAGALCSSPPCARAASTIISANGGTSASARAAQAYDFPIRAAALARQQRCQCSVAISTVRTSSCATRSSSRKPG